MKKNFFWIIFCFCIWSLAFTNQKVWADNTSTIGGVNLPNPNTEELVIPNPLGENSILPLINNIINWMFTFAIPIAVIMLMYAGFLYITSSGNKKQVEQAGKILMYALVGLAVIILAKGIVSATYSILTGKQLNLEAPSTQNSPATQVVPIPQGQSATNSPWTPIWPPQ